MPGELTETTELATALGTLASDLPAGLARRPPALVNVSDAAWDRLVDRHRGGLHHDAFTTAFANGQALLHANDALRGRRPRLVEWKGPHRPPGDDVIPADLRLDHVYLVSCKYLSKVLLNAGPARLFDRVLVGEERSPNHWFAVTAPSEYQAFYEAALRHAGPSGAPEVATALTPVVGRELRAALADRTLPLDLAPPWEALCGAVARDSSRRWEQALGSPRRRLRLLWRMLRIATATYYVLGTDRRDHLRFRVDSAWDWLQANELRSLVVGPKPAGQPEVAWTARIRRRHDGSYVEVRGHVEVRWSHGRFVGNPEAKVYLDTPFLDVPGYHLLR